MKTIILALSSNRQSPDEIKFALNLAKDEKSGLCVAFIIDPQVPDSVFTKLVDVGFLGEKPGEEIHKLLLEEYKNQAEKKLKAIAGSGELHDIQIDILLKTGDFVEECLKIIQEKNASKIIVVRSNRSKWARLLFGSPVDELMKKSPCPVKIFEE